MRHRFIAFPLAALASLALASVALAGGWAEVTATSGQIDPPAGEETTLNLRVLQHGVTPVSWPGLTVVATDATSGDVILAKAQAKGPEGSYVVTLVFPSAGQWNLTFESSDLVMEGSMAMNVAPSAAVAQSVAAAQPTVATTAASASDGLLLIFGLIAAAVALSLAIAIVILRTGGSSADTRVSART